MSVDRKKAAMAIGGIAVLGLAAYFLFSQKTVDDFGPSGGGSAGQSAGYEGGGAGITYQFGGDTIAFPGGGDNSGLESLLNALKGDTIPEGTTKKETNSAPGNLPIVAIFQKPADYTETAMANREKYGIPAHLTAGNVAEPAAAPNLFGGLTSLFGAVLGISTGVPRTAIQAAAGVKKTITGGSITGTGVLGSAAGGYTGSSGGIIQVPSQAVTSYQTGGSSHVASYVQGTYGKPGSGYVVRGYSLTGVPLYKPVGA